MNFGKLIDTFRISKDSAFKPTHTCMKGGKFYIPPNAYDDFIRLYADEINAGKTLTITEAHPNETDYSPMCIDFDFRYNDGTPMERQFSNDIVKYVAGLYRKHIADNLVVSNEQLSCYATIRGAPYRDAKSNDIKDGFHLMFPIGVPYSLQHYIRNRIMDELIHYEPFNAIPFKNSIQAIVDDAVIQRNNWLMYGSSKPDLPPYTLFAIWDYKDDELTIPDTKTIISTLSLRRPIERIAFKSALIEKTIQNEVPKKRTKKPAPIIQESSAETDTDNSSNDSQIIEKENPATTQKRIQTILDALSPKRWIEYTDWRTLYCVYLALDIPIADFHRRSQLNCPDKFNLKLNTEILSGLTKSNKYTIATLYYWLKQDHPALWAELQKQDNYFWNIMMNPNHSDLAKLHFQTDDRRRFAYCEKTGWYRYNEFNIMSHVGNKDPSGFINDITDNLQRLLLEQRNLLVPSKKGNDELYKLRMKAFQSMYGKVGTASFVEGVIKFLKPLLTVEDLAKILNSKHHLLAFNNKLYDVQKGEFRPIHRDDYISFTTGYNAPTRRITDKDKKDLYDFINGMFETPEMTDFWFKAVALSFFTNRFQNMYIFTGSGGNGKGLSTDLIQVFAGDYVYTTDNSFLTSTFKSGQANATLADLQGRRFVIVSEPADGGRDGKLNIEFVKSMTGGDKITTRALYCNNFTYISQFTLFLQCNQKPEFDKIDGGIQRRVKVISYPYSFVDYPDPKNPMEKKKNNNIKDEYLLTDKTRDVFATMVLEIATKHYLDKTIDIPDSVKIETQEYLDDNNPIKSWIETCLTITSDSKDRIKASELLKEYNSHPDTEIKLSSSKFGNLMAFNKIKKIKTLGQWYYTNVQLKKIVLHNDHYAFEDEDNVGGVAPSTALYEKEL